MANKLTYDDGWIRAGVKKLEARYSNVLVYETSDPERVLQLRRWFEGEGRPAGGTLSVSHYDDWSGLTPPEKGGGASGQFEVVDGGSSPLTDALRALDHRLKASRCVAVLDNPNPLPNDLKRLQDALRSWANDPKLRQNRSSIILFAGGAASLLDDHTRSRCIVIDAPTSSDAERKSIMEAVAGKWDGSMNPLLTMTKGLNLHETTSVILEAFDGNGRIDPEAVIKAKSALIKQCKVLEVVDRPEKSFHEIGGYEAVKTFLKDHVIHQLVAEERAKRFRGRMPRGILFFGPPGTGKTLFANAIAKELCLPFICLLAENLFSSELGASGQNLSAAIRKIESMSPAVVFIDEIDRLGKRGRVTDSAGEETRRVFSQMLDWLGKPDRKSIIVGTTNRPEDLDEAFLRAGRLDFKIPILHPDREARFQILKIHLGISGAPTDSLRHPPMEDVKRMTSFLDKEIVAATELYSGGELEELIMRAKRVAIADGSSALGESHVSAALDEFRIDKEDRLKRLRESWQQVQSYSQEESFKRRIYKEWRHLLEDGAAS